MTFIIHAWKAERNVMTVRIGPAVAVDKARELEKMGLGSLHHRRSWQSIYDQLLLIAQDSVALCPDRAAPVDIIQSAEPHGSGRARRSTIRHLFGPGSGEAPGRRVEPGRQRLARIPATDTLIVAVRNGGLGERREQKK